MDLVQISRTDFYHVEINILDVRQSKNSHLFRAHFCNYQIETMIFFLYLMVVKQKENIFLLQIDHLPCPWGREASPQHYADTTTMLQWLGKDNKNYYFAA